MPEVIDTTKATPATPDILLNFQAAKGTEHNTLGSISQSIIPNYDVNKAAEYVNQPSFNTLDPKEGYSEMENQMSIGQSSLEQWRNGLSKAVANVPLKFMEGMGYAYGLGKWGVESGFDVKDIDKMINNDFAKYFHNASQSLDKALPMYGSFDYQDGNILQKMSTAKFWAGDFTDGLAFLASAYGGSFIGKGIGKAVGALGEALGATVETANTINKYTSYGAGTIYNTISESGFEAKDNYDLVYPLVKDKISKELRTKYTDETTGQLVISEEQLANEIEQESRLKAGQSAANVFTSNLAILSISNAWEMKAFLGNPIDDSKRLFRQIARGEIKSEEISAAKQALKGFGLGAISEGAYEEGTQNAIQQFQTKKALGKTDKNGFTGGYFDEWIKGWSTTEGQASMILGALIGGPFQARSHFSEAKEKIEHINFLTDQVEKQRNAIVASDKIYESYLKNKHKKDETGKLILNENNEPVKNEDWYKEKFFQIQLDQDYRTDKLNFVLEGHTAMAKIVDEFYKSRKIWAYLSNPIYENSKEAIEAFKATLETQANEYQEITRHINEEKKQSSRNAAGELETVAPVVPNKDELEKQTFKKDLLNALADVDAVQLEYDNIQKNIKLNPSNSKDSFLYEKLNKALFHEAIKRRALTSLLQDETLTEEVKKDILNLIDSSNEFSKELSTKEGREKYIGEVKSQQDVLNDKIKEFNDVLDKYKAKPAEEVKKTKFDKIKDKTKSLAKPIITRFQKKQSEATIPIEEPVAPTTRTESYTEEDKTKLRKLNYEISNHIYREGQGYLTRINDAYGNETMVGKKYQFYKELGEEQLRKSKVKDVIDKTLNQIDLLLDSQTINKKNYEELIAKLSELYSQLNEFSKKYNEDKNYTLTNFTKEDLDYLNQIIKEVKNTLEGYDELIDNSIKQVKEQLSQFNEYISSISDVTDSMLNFIDNLYEGDFSIEKEDVNMDVYNALGEDLLYLSFIHTYFITNEDIERAKNQAVKGIDLQKNIFIAAELYKAGEMSYDEAANILGNFIAENSIVNDSDEIFTLKKQEANLLLMSVPEIDAAQYFTLTNQLEDLNDIKNSFANNKESLNNELQTIFETSSKNVNKNKFLQLGDKPESLQNEFYESLYIEEENKDVVFNAIDYIVTKFEKDFKDKNETELSKIEDVIFFQNNLEELKFLNNILEEKDIKSKQLFDTKKSIDNFIKVLEDHIIPLAIKNQNNRKVFQEISLNVRDKNYFNQLGLNIEIDLEGKIILNGTSIKLVDLISKLYGQDLKDIKLSEKFNFINVEKIIDVLKSKSEEELKPLFDLIESLSKATAEDIRTFENTRGQKVFFSNTNFINYLENPDSVIERLIYDMSDFNNTASRTYGDKENWYSSPLYNYSKHLSPALLLDELKKKRFSGSMIMPYDKLATYIELHLEYTALFNLKKNLGSKLDYKNYYVNLREEFEKNAITPTYQQEIALREAYEWWNNPSLLISYLKGIAGTGKTSVVLKYFIETNKINLDNIILSAHEQSQVDTLKKTLSDTTSAFVLADLLTKDVAFFDKTQLLVIDEINANSEQVMAQILNKLTEINLTREENNKLKLMLLGDPTQLKASNIPFINYFTNENNKYSVKYSNFLKVFSPLTVAYRSDVGAVNNLSNTFRDTNKPIENIDVQSSATITDIEAKGVILTSTERSNGTLDSIINRITTIKDVNSTKAIIVANQETVELYNKQLALKGITGVEVVTITRAQGRTFDEAYIDIQKDKLKSTPLGLANKNDFEYFYNTAMYTAISRAKNLVLLFDNSGTFTHSINTDVLDTNKDLTKEKEELKSNMQKYLDFADRMYAIPKEEKPKTKPEEKIKEEEKEEEKEVETEEEIIEDELEEDVPGLGEEIILEEEPEVLTFETSDDIHEIQNPQVQVLKETKTLGEIVPAVAQIGNEVIYMKSSDGNIYAYVKSSRNPDLYEFLTVMYYDNLRDDVPSEKYIKDAYNKNSVKNLSKYTKEHLTSTYNKAHQIASGKLSYTQKLQFKYDTVENRSKVEKEIEEKGGLYNYLKEKLYPLVLKKGSDTDTYGDLVNFRVFVATRQDRNNEIPDSITDLKYGHPYLKFQVEKKDKEGKIRLQSFFVKLEAPMLKRTDSIIQPLITFNNSIKNIQNTFEDIGISISLKDEALHDLVLLFRKDFRAEESGISKDKKGNEIPGYKIVQKDETIITKEDVYKVLESYNLSDENLSKVLAIMQKESANLVPILFSAKKDKIKVSALGYTKFLEEEAAKGTIKLEDTTEYFQFIEELSKGIVNKQVNDIILNKVALNTINVVKSLRASNIELGEVSENLRRDVQNTRKDLTARSFVPIISGPNQGKFYALDPIIGQVVVIDTIPERRFVSQSYTTKNNIGMFDFQDLRLTRNNSKLQTNFNILARANGVLNKGTQNEVKIRLSYKVNKGTDQERAITFAPILIKDSKYDSNFDRGYYGILKLAFNNLIDQKKRNKEPFEFDLKYTDDGGNVIQFQYKEQLGKDGKSIWKDPTRIGKFRREASLQHENALEVMKNFLIEQKATFENGEIITQEALDKLENEKTKVDITTEDLDSMIGDGAFDESGTSLNYRKNVDRDYIYSSQDTSHGGSKFEDNIPLQNAVTTRLNKVLPSRAQVKLNGVQTKTEEPIKPKEKPKKIERKTILEKGNYTLDQMENGKYRIFDNGENPQELYEYEDMNEAIDKFNSINNEIVSNLEDKKVDIERRRIETEAKIKRKDLFSAGGIFSNELGGSGVNSVPTNHREVNGIEFVEFSNPNTGVVDVIMTGVSGSDFVGYYRLYENGKPTNKWSSKFENQSRNKDNFKTMISGVQEMLPQGHEYTEKTSISTDGLRVWNQQLSKGYELQYDNNGNLITNTVTINGDAIVNELGIDVNQGNFDNISVTSKGQFESVKKALLPYLQKFGLNESNIRNVNGTVEIDLPILKNNKIQQGESRATSNQSEIADIKIGKVDNTNYEIKADGVYYQGKKLDNPENKTHRQLIEADIERRRQEDLEKKVQILKDKRNALRGEDGVVPKENIAEWQQLGKDVIEAQNKATRGNNEGFIPIRTEKDGVLSGEDAINAENEIERVIQKIIKGEITIEQAVSFIHNKYKVLANENEFLLNYINDRTSNAPEIGNNKQSFPAWRKGKYDTELTALEPTKKQTSVETWKIGDKINRYDSNGKFQDVVEVVENRPNQIRFKQEDGSFLNKNKEQLNEDGKLPQASYKKETVKIEVKQTPNIDKLENIISKIKDRVTRFNYTIRSTVRTEFVTSNIFYLDLKPSDKDVASLNFETANSRETGYLYALDGTTGYLKVQIGLGIDDTSFRPGNIFSVSIKIENTNQKEIQQLADDIYKIFLPIKKVEKVSVSESVRFKKDLLPIIEAFIPLDKEKTSNGYSLLDLKEEYKEYIEKKKSELEKLNVSKTTQELIEVNVVNDDVLEIILNSIVESEELDENEKEAYGRRLVLLFDKNPQDTLDEFISKVADTFDVEESIIKEYVEGEQAKKNCL